LIKGLYSDRRHRINSDEVEPVRDAVEKELRTLIETRSDFDKAEPLFKVLFRFDNYFHRRPPYPNPITWETIEDWIGEKGSLSYSEPTEDEIKQRFEEDD
jgi:hypothetical protein